MRYLIRKHLYPIQLLFILYIFSLMLSSCNSQQQDLKIIKGVLDLRLQDSCKFFKKNKVIKLTGEWEFYWKKFIMNNIEDKELNYVTLPNNWNNLLIGNENIGSEGYATYHIKILLDKKDRVYTIKTPVSNTAFKLFIDGKLKVSNGKVGKSKETSISGYSPTCYSFKPESTKIDLTIWVSNYSYQRGGLPQPFLFGTDHAIYNYREKINVIAVALIILYLLIGIYNFILFFLRKNRFHLLYMGLMCIVICTGLLLVPDLSFFKINGFYWGWGPKLFIIMKFSGISLFLLYICSLFPEDSNSNFQKILVINSVISIILTIFIKENLIIYFEYYSSIVLIINIIYWIILLFSTVMKKRLGALFITMSSIIIFPFLIYDITIGDKLFNDFLSAYFVFIVFVFSQSFFLTYRYIITTPVRKNLSKFRNEIRNNFVNQFSITIREREILILILEGLSSKEIAYKFDISIKTVENHTYNLYQKIDIHTRVEILAKFHKFTALSIK